MAYTAKSTGITNLDTIPAVKNTSGENGGIGYLRSETDTITPTVGQLGSTATTLAVLRLPSNAKLKRLYMVTPTKLDSNGAPTLTWDIGAYYSDSTVDGTAVANQGVAISVNSFAAIVATPAAAVQTDVLAAYSPTARNQPLWQGLGLSADPGGYIDIVAAVHAAAATAVSGVLGLDATFAM